MHTVTSQYPTGYDLTYCQEVKLQQTNKQTKQLMCDITECGNIALLQPGLHVTRFHWLNVYKRIGSMFVGTSPEYDLSVFTLCFLTRAGGKCYISMDGNERSITTYTMSNVRPKAVGTAYPDC